MFSSKPQHLSSKFLNGLSEQAKGRSAWFYAFVFLMVYQFTVVSKLSGALENGEKILVPYSLMMADKEIRFSADYSEGSNYLLLIAEADVALWGNTRPDNVSALKQKFLSRFHPNLYRIAKEEIIKEAMMDEEREVTRSFEVENSYIDKNGMIRIDGISHLDVAGVKSPHLKESIILTYMKGASGYPYIQGWKKVKTSEIVK